MRVCLTEHKVSQLRTMRARSASACQCPVKEAFLPRDTVAGRKPNSLRGCGTPSVTHWPPCLCPRHSPPRLGWHCQGVGWSLIESQAHSAHPLDHLRMEFLEQGRPQHSGSAGRRRPASLAPQVPAATMAGLLDGALWWSQTQQNEILLGAAQGSQQFQATERGLPLLSLLRPAEGPHLELGAGRAGGIRIRIIIRIGSIPRIRISLRGGS